MFDLGFWTLQGLNALQLSMLLFLLSIGLTVIFGLMHFVNLAHGSLYALGAYFGATLAGFGGYWAGFFLAPVAVAGVGVLLYSGLIRRMRKSGPMAQVLVTFGLIFVMLDLTRIFWGDLALAIEVPQVLVEQEIRDLQLEAWNIRPIGCSSLRWAWRSLPRWPLF